LNAIQGIVLYQYKFNETSGCNDWPDIVGYISTVGDSIQRPDGDDEPETRPTIMFFVICFP